MNSAGGGLAVEVLVLSLRTWDSILGVNASQPWIHNTARGNLKNADVY